ncbi:hypothetical protein HBI56_123000 [Parastagonospora nodorum]|uniref:DUF5071 domain-containing protein n=2 Tax=Phaeosphaeria nodorum (strain SN15 / ATCC MYA-4574 / FGSC 10173) TaxID=321614 RepID=A0A7U2F478_PHANO|nr:hypothetical protein SNOG_04459 [Parastagonospora nodorum SN15]KAH3914688.1 hypothetical protein HBH56_092680 [Parastagonospora nodorum]EAT88219.1 hypothetical protein SNOG_04459 [Parastagonospora nodorum SN15]KAH3936280.1 hypothetical protein HBH54_027330 [Parastagonospora nodorum]KAH3948208.1 hypothetical protein HBH53_102150 [Parastagonospora nodorum]KAH3956459.1 hypothetical protein HBH51_241420 [Parastagonospora nodorum]
MPSPHPLMPRDRHDSATLTHLKSLGPSTWAPLIPPSAPDGGLLHWLEDINWPIARPISKLLVSLADDVDAREQYGHYLVDTVNKLFKSSEDWEWVYYVLVYVVCEVEDKEWARSKFGDGVRGLEGRMRGEEEKEWGFGEYIGKLLEEDWL